MLQNVNYLIVDYTIILVSIIRKFIPRLSDHVDRLKFYIITRKKKKKKKIKIQRKKIEIIYIYVFRTEQNQMSDKNILIKLE